MNIITNRFDSLIFYPDVHYCLFAFLHSGKSKQIICKLKTFGSDLLLFTVRLILPNNITQNNEIHRLKPFKITFLVK